MLEIVNEFLTNYLAPASAVMASIVAYTAVYKNSEPQLVVYYHPSQRQQTMIDLVIENIGNGNAIDIKFSKPIPIGWNGIETPATKGNYIPTSGIPPLAPGQRLVFPGGQFAGLSKELGTKGIELDITYKFNPPLRCQKKATDTCVLSVEHLAGMQTIKSLEQAVVDAIEGRNQTTIKNISNSLQKIERNLVRLNDSIVSNKEDLESQQKL